MALGLWLLGLTLAAEFTLSLKEEDGGVIPQSLPVQIEGGRLRPPPPPQWRKFSYSPTSPAESPATMDGPKEKSGPCDIPYRQGSPNWWKQMFRFSAIGDLDHLALQLLHVDEERQAAWLADLNSCLYSTPLLQGGFYRSILSGDDLPETSGSLRYLDHLKLDLEQVRRTECVHLLVKDLLPIPHLLRTWQPQAGETISFVYEPMVGVTWRQWLQGQAVAKQKPIMVASLVLTLIHLQQNYHLILRSLSLDTLWLLEDGLIMLDGLTSVVLEPAPSVVSEAEAIPPEVKEGGQLWGMAADWYALGHLIKQLEAADWKKEHPAFDLVENLCLPNPNHRWGSMLATVSWILAHPYFREVNWSELMI